MTPSPPIPIIFLAFANDRQRDGAYLRNLAEEARRLQDSLRPAEQAGLCHVSLVCVARVKHGLVDPIAYDPCDAHGLRPNYDAPVSTLSIFDNNYMI